MDIIENYLNTMFSSYPQTPRTLEAKAELRSMMEDAYNGALAAGRTPNEALGQAITEFGNLDEVAPLLGLTSHDAATEAVYGDGAAPFTVAPAPVVRPAATITVTQAMNYADAYKRTRWLLTGAVVLFIVAPLPLISLTILADNTLFALNDVEAVIIGFAFLAPVVAIGVAMLVWRASKLAPFQRIVESLDEPSSGVIAWAESLRGQHSSRRTFALIVAVLLWILAPLPLILTALLSEQVEVWGEQLVAFGMIGTAVLVACGLAVFLPNNWAHQVAYNVVEDDEDHDSTADRPPLIRAIYAGYWPLMVAIYLAWSFIGNAWGTSWILWPIAGVSFGAFAAFTSAWSGETK